MLLLRGGTDAAFAPPIDYLSHVLLPTLARLLGPAAAGLGLQLVRRGFFPRGGGEAVLTVPALPPGARLPCWDLTQRGVLVRVDCHAFTAGRVRPQVGSRMADAAADALRQAVADPAVLLGGPAAAVAGAAAGGQQVGVPPAAAAVEVARHVVHEPGERAVGDGAGLLLVAATSSGCLLGASARADKGVPAEAVGVAAAQELREALASGAAVDEWCTAGA